MPTKSALVLPLTGPASTVTVVADVRSAKNGARIDLVRILITGAHTH
jgi:hypothetical protein